MIDENCLIIPGQLDITCTFSDRGHFEGGKWVTLFTPMLEYFRDNNVGETKHELTVTVPIPIFSQGACTGYRMEDRSLGLYTSAELKEIIKVEGIRKKEANDGPV